MASAAQRKKKQQHDGLSRGPREWISAVRSAKLRDPLAFDFLLDPSRQPGDGDEENAECDDAEAQAERVHQERLQRRINSARSSENCRYERNHRMRYSRIDSENSSKAVVDAWQRKERDKADSSDAYTPRERTLWYPVSEGFRAPLKKHSRILLYRFHDDVDKESGAQSGAAEGTTVQVNGECLDRACVSPPPVPRSKKFWLGWLAGGECTQEGGPTCSGKMNLRQLRAERQKNRRNVSVKARER